MIAHVAPANRSCDYSLNSLRYAERLRAAAANATAAATAAPAAAAPAAAANTTRATAPNAVASATPAPAPAPNAVAAITAHHSTAAGVLTRRGAAAVAAVPPPPSEPPASPARRPPRAPGLPMSAAPAPLARMPCAGGGGGSDGSTAAGSVATSTTGGDSGGEPTKHAKAVEALRELLRCAYDPEAWAAEVAYLDRTQADDLGGCIERVEGVLAERIRLFTSLQADLSRFKAHHAG